MEKLFLAQFLRVFLHFFYKIDTGNDADAVKQFLLTSP